MQLFPAESFRDDWYGYLTNQISHTSIGVFMTWAVAFAGFVVLGEFPYRTQILILLATGYMAYELFFQGWNSFDTIEDWMFFSLYGAGGTVMSFREFEVGSGAVVFDMTAPAIIFPIMILHLLAGCLLRWRLSERRQG